MKLICGYIKFINEHIIKVKLSRILFDDYSNPSLFIQSLINGYYDKYDYIFIDLNDIKNIEFPHIDIRIKQYNDKKILMLI